MPEFIDFRTSRTLEGGFIGATDYRQLAVDEVHKQIVFYGYDKQAGSLQATITAHRNDAGQLTVVSSVPALEPVVEDEQLIGVRL